MENRTIYNSECENDITGINNNIVIDSAPDTDESDFDRLLDEFLKSTLEEDDDKEPSNDDFYGKENFIDEDEDFIDEDEVHDPEDELMGFDEYEYGTVECRIGSHNYILPGQPDSVCKAEKIVLTYGDYEGRKLRGEPLAFVYDADNSRTYFTLHEVVDYNKRVTPVLYVYAEANPYPICRYAFDVEEGEITEGIASLVNFFDEVVAGNYFFYLCGVEVDGLSTVYNNCNGGCCIPFVKVDGDMELPPVALEAAGVKTGSRYCSLDVSLKFDKPLGKEYAYTLFLYNRNYNLVSRGATFSWDNYSVRKRKNLLTHMTATYIPFGAYRLFVLQNGIPRWKVEFFVEGGKATVTAFSDIKQFGNEFLLLYGLEKESDWHRFREGDATVEMKEYFLSTYQRGFLNKKRRAMGLNALSTSMHFVYNGGNSVSE